MTEEPEIDLHQFELDLTPGGIGFRVVVDGINLAEHVNGVELSASARGAPVLVLHSIFPGRVRGEGIVLLREGGVSAAELLASIDPEVLEQNVNEYLQDGNPNGAFPETVGAATLMVLAAYADELAQQDLEEHNAGRVLRPGSDRADEQSAGEERPV